MTLKPISDARARVRIRPGNTRALVYRRGRKQDHTLGWVHLDADLACLPVCLVPPNVALPDYVRPELDAVDIEVVRAAILAHRAAHAWPTLHPDHIASLRASWTAAEASAALDVPAPTPSDLHTLVKMMKGLAEGGLALSPEMRERQHPAHVRNELDAAWLEMWKLVLCGQVTMKSYLPQPVQGDALRVQVRDWEDDAAVLIPASALKAARMRVGQSLELRAAPGRLFLEPVTENLEDLLDKITPENRHPPALEGRPAGTENC